MRLNRIDSISMTRADRDGKFTSVFLGLLERWESVDVTLYSRVSPSPVVQRFEAVSRLIFDSFNYLDRCEIPQGVGLPPFCAFQSIFR